MLLIIVILLVVAGFFFPPIWIGVLLFVGYMIATRASRRDAAIEDRLKRMIRAGQDFAVFNDLYFEAASSYAKSKGAKYGDSEGASANAVIDGRVYSVVFSRAIGGGTSIDIEDYDVAQKRLKSLMDEMTGRNN